MTLSLILTIAACLAIGVYAGLSIAKNKYQARIERLQRTIDNLRNPPPEEQ